MIGKGAPGSKEHDVSGTTGRSEKKSLTMEIAED